MELGIGSWTYPWNIGVAGYPLPEKPMKAMDLLYRAKELGVNLVQICDNIPLHEMNAEELRHLRDTAEELGITLQIGTRGIQPEHLLRYLEIAGMLNSKLVRTITDTQDCKPTMEQAVGWIRKVMPEFEREKVSIAVENHDRFKVGELAGFIEKIGSSCLGICLDTVNSFGALECPSEVVSVLSPYVVNLHIKDFQIARIDNKMGFVVKGSPAGQGMLDMDRVFTLLKEKGREPDVILEQWPPFEGTIEKTIITECMWAEQSIHFLRNYLNLYKS